MTDEPPSSLAAFAETNAPRRGSYMDSLPPEIRDQVVRSYGQGISAAVVARWLQSSGYPRVTIGMVDVWRRKYVLEGTVPGESE
jgi:hypothetical protein